MTGQRARLAAAVRAVADTADDPARLRAHLAAVGRGCATLGADPAQVDAAAAALLQSLADQAGPAWTDDIRSAWTAIVGRAAAELRAAASTNPAGCGATVLRHRRTGSDTAMLTVHPDRPYPYAAGQHAAVRLLRPGYDAWRPLAFASAPRADNQITFWARTGGGHISRALVAHVQPGDRLRLGPPLGHQLVAPANIPGLVIVCAGEGYPAVRAVLDQAARWDNPPPVRVYMGLRVAGDAWLLDDLRGVARVLPDVPVGLPAADVARVAAEAEAGRAGRGGPEAIRDRQHVLLAGPPRMVRDAADLFTRLGMPPGRIHADSHLPTSAAYGRTLAP